MPDTKNHVNLVSNENRKEKIESKIKDSSKRLENLKENKGILYRLFPAMKDRAIQRTLDEYQKEMNEWKELTGKAYIPEKDFMEDFDLRYTGSSGSYRIPDDLCPGEFNKELREDLEKYMEKEGIEIPMEIGMKMEEEFRKGGTMWLHRTQIGSDYDKSLSEIGKKGLICSQSDLENTATPFHNYTMMMQQLVVAWKYRQESCQGVVVIRTGEEPDIKNQKLNPEQIIGYVGNDHGDLTCFISREEMCQMYDPAKEQNAFQSFEDYMKEQISDVKEQKSMEPALAVSRDEGERF